MLDIKINERGGPRAILDSLDQAAQDAVDAVVQQWWRDDLPKHFTPEGAKLYNYQPRTNKYMAMKWRKFHTRNPLQLTGRSKAMAEAGIEVKTRVIKKRDEIQARGVMNVPDYFYKYRTDQNAPDKANELTRTTPDEEAELSRTLAEHMPSNLARISGSKVFSDTIR